MVPPVTLNVVGCGRVGQTLARLWQAGGWAQVQGLHARTARSMDEARDFIGAGQPCPSLNDLRPARVWMLSVPDTQIAQVATALAATGCEPAIAFHCSGFQSAAALQPLRERGWQVASAHPVLNFASPQTGVEQFAGTPCGLEGDAAAVALVRAGLEAIGGDCFEVDGEAKALYHGAAVFCSNFVIVLQAVAQDTWRRAGVSEELICRLNARLLESSVRNALELGPARALTGPASRNDRAVVGAQAEAFDRFDPLAAEAYRALSALAFRMAGHEASRP
jgi:predicted short-subunit dehydrogenase-like oxidoreductase (DUF2520 family)